MHSIASVKKNLDRYLRHLGFTPSTEEEEEEIIMVDRKANTGISAPTEVPPEKPLIYANKPINMLTLAEKEHRLLTQAKVDLANCQREFIEKLIAISDRIARHKMNLEWLKQNPMAEEIFTKFLDREIAAHDNVGIGLTGVSK